MAGLDPATQPCSARRPHSRFGARSKRHAVEITPVRLTADPRLVPGPASVTRYCANLLEQMRKINESVIRAPSVPEGERFLNKGPHSEPCPVTDCKPCGPWTLSQLTLFLGRLLIPLTGPVPVAESCRKETNAQPTEQSLNRPLVSDSDHLCSPLNPSVKRVAISPAKGP